MPLTPMPQRRPPIVLCETDRRSLERAALLSMLEAPRVAGALLDEVDRAMVVPDAGLHPERVRLGSLVLYRDETSGEEVCARLVEDSRPGAPMEVSVLTSEGAALVGLSAGQSILWSDRRGEERLLTILETSFGDQS